MSPPPFFRTLEVNCKQAVSSWLAMAVDVCNASSTVGNFTFKVLNVTYFYQSCMGRDADAVGLVADCIRRIQTPENEPQCAQFCEDFQRLLPRVYAAISCVSLICCLGVFVTYFSFPRLRQSGYSSKVFLYRSVGQRMPSSAGHN